LRPEQLALLDLDGELVDPSGPRPSSEVKMHLAIYRFDPGTRAVVHAHPMFATMWAITGEPLNPKMLPETVVTMPQVPLAKYATPSTAAVPESITGFVKSHNACLLEHHGALTWAPTLEAAYQGMERLEYTAEITWRLREAGRERQLPPAEVDHIWDLFEVPPARRH
jgi:L-fuculose-phosphate aldolase